MTVVVHEDAGCWSPSDAVLRLQKAHRAAKPALGAERALHYTAFFRGQADKYPDRAIRMARALAYHLEHRSIAIHADEMIVGSHTEHRIGAICQPELAGVFMLEDLPRLATRAVNPLQVEKQVARRLMRQVVPYWLRRNLAARAFPGWRGVRYTAGQFVARDYVITEAGGIAHFLPGYAEIVRLGTDGLRGQIAQARAAMPHANAEQVAFWAAQEIVLNALDAFADRYAELARAQGRDDLVALLSRVPRKAPASVHEALQLIWFFQVVLQIESLDQGVSLGRIDQILAPVYRAEKEAGTWDPDRFRDLVCALSIKMSEVVPLLSQRVTQHFSGLPTGQAAIVGGCRSNTEHDENALSFLLLDVMEQFPQRQPNWHARVGTASSAAFRARVAAVVAGGNGSPALYNDDVIVPAMVKRGVPAELAWDYATVGCVEPAPSGVSFTSSDAALVNLPIALERVLGGGRRYRTTLGWLGRGKREKKLASIHNLEDLYARVATQMEAQLQRLKHDLDAIEKANADLHPTPFSSLTVAGCIETATDLTRGGARYNATGVQGVGLADLANALAAVNQFVFVEKTWTLPQLAEACRRNFAGQERLRAKLQGAPKYGNDNPEVDAIARRLAAIYDGLVSQHTNTRGGPWAPGLYSMTCHQTFGARTGALPSGRRRAQSFADGLAPVDGSDRLGPTASLQSVLAIDHTGIANGINLNIKFEANTLSGSKGPEVLAALWHGYFDQGGMQMQVNVLDPAILERAMADPDQYANLLVRVSGYSAYFVDLTPQMQAEILARTSQLQS